MLTLEPYNRATLDKILELYSHNSSPTVALKGHAKYLDGYLSEIGAKAVLVESEYTDRDYLEDYAAYYARCAQEYKRTCARAHFFSSAVTQEDLDAAFALDQDRINAFEGSYLGFIVLKPLPCRTPSRTTLHRPRRPARAPCR